MIDVELVVVFVIVVPSEFDELLEIGDVMYIKICLLAVLLSPSLTVITTGKTPTTSDCPTIEPSDIDIPSGSPVAE